MLIQVADIPPEGLRIEGTADFPRPFQDHTWALDDLALTIEKDGDTVFVRGDLSARVPLTCGRCVEGYTVTVHPAVDARFVPMPATRGEERELGAGELETDVYQHGTLDLTALLETETTLALPMKPLCREGCRVSAPSAAATATPPTARARRPRPTHAGRPSRTGPAGRDSPNRSPPMPLPKRRHSKTRGRKRRTHYKMVAPTRSLCPQCREVKPPHHICPHCGFYKGREVISVEGE